MGSYYREWLLSEQLLHSSGCQDAKRIFVRADKDQRTLETGRALGEALLPGCEVDVHAGAEGQADSLFSGFGSPDPERMLAAVRERLGPDPQKLLTDHRRALDELQAILGGKADGSVPIAAALRGKSVELTGPFATGSTFSENLLLEYANGLRGDSLGWGRLTRENLERVLEIHSVYADLMRRTPYLARARGSNLLLHMLRSLEQAVSGAPVAGALGKPGDVVLVLAGHDTNLSNLSGMLGLSWKLDGYQPDDTPPGGALICSIWYDAAARQYSLRLRYLAQTLEQMRRADPLSRSAPPEGQDLILPGCAAVNCPWDTARRAIDKAIDPAFAEKN
jgi:4-phytase/acid phosphatase